MLRRSYPRMHALKGRGVLTLKYLSDVVNWPEDEIVGRMLQVFITQMITTIAPIAIIENCCCL